MVPITQSEFALFQPTCAISDEEFSVLSLLAADLIDLLTYGLAEENESQARRAAAEQIAFWFERGGISKLRRDTGKKSESVGNYAVAYDAAKERTVSGLPVSPAALMILTNAGLRNPTVR